MTVSNSASTETQESKMEKVSVKCTKRNYLFIVQKRIGAEWQRINDGVFTRRKFARECAKELRTATKRDYRVRKMVIAS
jgi:hypothetical protein